MFYYLLVAVYVLVCLLLLVSILLQQGRAGDIASAFGGSSSQTVFGARSGATMLTRATDGAGGAVHARIDRAGHRVAEGPVRLAAECAASRPGKRPSTPPSSVRCQRAPAARPAAPACARGAACGRRPRSRTSSTRPPLRKWRNWQTHQLEGLALARAWGFESPLPHQTSLACPSDQARAPSRQAR